jgi:hypothetical protein
MTIRGLVSSGGQGWSRVCDWRVLWVTPAMTPAAEISGAGTAAQGG